MGDSHTRSMDGGWNPGEVWPAVPVECLLNGMTTDTHLMFGGNAMFPPHFRHRFQSPVHLSPAHLAPLPGPINVNVSIPITQHSLVEAVPVDETGNPSIVIGSSAAQQAHSMQQQLQLVDEDVMDETDDGTDEDDDEEVEDNISLTMTHEQQHAHSASMSLGHGLEADSLVPCQQQHAQIVRNPLQQQQQMLSIDTPQLQSCMQEKTASSGRLTHEDHSESISAMTMAVNDDFTSQTSTEGDPNSGFTVHGKMYFEGRVVLHLKQWMDPPTSDGSSVLGGLGTGFASCTEPQHQKGGCAVCRLKSPSYHENHRNQKEAHRHTVKGVLFTFEDCIIVELYPEPPPVDPKPPPPEPQRKDHHMHAESYMTSVTVHPQEDQSKKFMHQLDVNCISTGHTPDPPSKHDPTSEQQQAPDDHSWWDEFESGDDLKRGEEELDQDTSSNPPDSACISELKIQTQQQDDEHQDCDFASAKSSDCSESFLNQRQLESHTCQSHSIVALEDVDLSSEPNSIHASSANDKESIVVVQSSEESQESSETNPSVCSIVLPKNSKGDKKTKSRHACPKCEESFPLKRLLKQHLDKMHPCVTPFPCPHCDQKFSEYKRLRKHSCHARVVPQAEKQESTFRKTSQDSGTSAIVFMDGEGSSDKTSSDDDELSPLESNIPSNEADQTSTPNLAVEESSSSQENNDVINDNSGDDDDSAKCSHVPIHKKRSGNQKPYTCEICGKRFTVERRLENHKLSHNTERSSQCEKCGKRFARKDKLMRHMYVHSEEKMFSCDICQKRFSRRDKLSDHLKSHGGADEIHNCPMCQKQFLRPDILKQHVKLHTMKDKHQCPECLRFVTGKDRLEKHMARHKEAKALGQTLLCPLCTKYFIQKQSLKAHVKKFHPDANINLDSVDSDLPHQLSRNGAPDSDGEPLDLLQSKDIKLGSKSKPFGCSQCPRAFVKKQALRKHLRRHQSSPSKSSNHTKLASPSLDEKGCEAASALSATPSVPVVSNDVSSITAVTASTLPALSQPHPSSSPQDVNGSTVPNIHAGVPVTHISIVPPTLTPTQCPPLHHSAHDPHGTQHHPHHHLVAHGTHSGHTSQISSLAHPTGHMNASLSQQIAVPPMQHHVSMATSQPVCGSSYVLAYPHYSYQ